MSALSKFLDRHGLDETFRAKAGFYASLAVVAAAAALAPLKAKAAEDSYLGRHSPIGGVGISERLGMIAERTNDRLADMVAISRAIRNTPDLNNPHDHGIAAAILIEINNRFYSDTPHPQLAKHDLTPLGLPGNLAEGAAMEYAVSAINFQKETLLEATEALKDIVDAYNHHNTRSVRLGANRLEQALESYRVSEPRVLDSLRSSLRSM